VSWRIESWNKAAKRWEPLAHADSDEAAEAIVRAHVPSRALRADAPLGAWSEMRSSRSSFAKLRRIDV
jgi:hypothetical protein